MKTRESLSSRIGFILLSAGCAIGIGNVYRFPIITGYYGGGFFVLFYALFLIILGLPIMSMELAVGRSSKKSIAMSFDELEKPKQVWHIWKYFGIAGNYILMMCYTTIVAWIALYFIHFIKGDICVYQTTPELGAFFGGILEDNLAQIITVFVIIILGFGICALGLKNGVERASKVLMLLLFVIIIGIGIYCCTMPGAAEGIKFYLVPSAERLVSSGVPQTISAAMSQAFFTLSLGIGSIGIFGSYIGKERRLTGEASVIIILDTVIALLSGLIIFPACYTYAGGVDADGSVGAGFIFTTFSGIFNNMGGVGGQVLGALFFALLLFAAFSTVIAVFENIMAFWMDLTNLKRPIVALINIGILCVLSIPCILSNNVWSGFAIAGHNIMDMEDILVSKILLPLGCIVYCVFCSSKFGWGFDNYIQEVNTGKSGLRMPSNKFMKIYLTYILPVLVLVVFVFGFVF